MHTLKLAVFDPPDDPMTFDVARAAIGELMWRWTAFTRRLVHVPGDLHHPVWVPVGELDLTYHVRRAQIPAPGDHAAMDTLVGRLAGWPLDRDRPLWQVWFLEGLNDGRMAVLMKLHHCVADGVAANALLASLMAEPGDSGDARRVDRSPTRRELLADASRDLIGDLRGLPQVLRDMRHAVKRRRDVLTEMSRTGVETPPRPILDTPVTSFNRAITAARSVATTTLDLAPVLAAKERYGCSVNDVFLTLVGGALTEVLASAGEHPKASLTASVPVSSEPRRTGNTEPRRTGNTEPRRTGNTEPRRTGNTEPRRTGNKVSNLFVSLHTEIADPGERAVAVHASTVAAKRLHDALGADVMETLLSYTPPRPYRWVMQAYSGLDLADRHRAPVNVICSNVPGPREQLAVAGVKLVEFYSAGPVLEGIGVNVTAWSYADRMDVMVIACARAMPEPSRLTEALHRQLDALGEG
jgi:diacylglycerol O-acyltransferase